MDVAASRSRVSRGHDAVTTREELVAAFAERYPAVWDALQEQGGPELGEVVAVYHSIGEDELVLSAGIEVQEDFSPRDPLAPLALGGCETGTINQSGTLKSGCPWPSIR